MSRVNLGTDSSGRPLVVDDRTLAKLRLAESRLGFTFTIVQGSWRGNAGAAASADTHARGGVVDLRSWNLPASISPQEAVTELRRAGLIAWYRTTAQGFDPHIHAIDYGNPDLDPSAARQVAAWEQGRNGLASNGYDDGARVPIPKSPPREPKTLPPRVQTSLAEILAEIKRVRAARETARKNGEPLPKYGEAIRALRAARLALRKVPKR